MFELIKQKKKSFLFFGIFVFLLGLYFALSPLGTRDSLASPTWLGVGDVGAYGSNTSLAFDSSGNPYVAYKDSSDFGIKVKEYTNSAWSTVGDLGVANLYGISMAFDSADNIYILARTTSHQLIVKEYSGESWSIVGSGFASTTSYYSDIAIYNNVPYVAYIDSDNGLLPTVMSYQGGNWNLIGSPNFGQESASVNPSFTFDNNGIPYIAFVNNSDKKPHVMKYDAGNWSDVSTSTDFGDTMETSNDKQLYLKFDNLNRPYLAYLTSSNKINVLKYFNGNWLDRGPSNFSNGSTVSKLSFDLYNTMPYVFFKDNAESGKGTVMTYNAEHDLWDVYGSAGFTSGQIDGTYFNKNSNGTLYLSYFDLDDSNKVTVMSYYNVAPVASSISATSTTDGTGYVNISETVSDVNYDNLSISYRYSLGACDTYDGSQATSTINSLTTSTYGYDDITLDTNDSGGYQVQSVTTTPGANTVEVVWDSKTDLPSANGDIYCIYAFAHDGTVSSTVATTTVTLDNYQSAPTIADSSATKDSITFSWSAVSGASSYYVQINSETAIVTTDTSYTFSSLSANISYTIGVKAVDSYGNSSSYDTSSVTTDSAGGGGFIPAPSSGSGSSSNSIGINETKEVGSLTSEGNNFLVYIGSEINFDLGSAISDHKATVKDLDTITGKVILVLQSSPVTISLLPKETKDVDLTGDGKNDIRIKYNELKVNRIDLTVTKLATSTEIREVPNTSQKSCSLEVGGAYKIATSPIVYYITQDCTRRYFINASVYFTYFDSWKNIKIVSEEELKKIPADQYMKAPLGPKFAPKYSAVVQVPGSPDIYVLENNQKYLINDENTFVSLGFKWNWIELVDQSFLSKYIMGEKIADANKVLNYTLIKYSDSNKVYRLESDPYDSSKQIKRYIPSEEEFKKLGFRFDRIVTIDKSYTYADGMELKS